MEKNYVSHLECSITGKKYEANKIHGLSDAGRPVSYTHLRAHETRSNLVCRLRLEK